MKKIIAGMLMFSCIVSANAAQVSFQVGQDHLGPLGSQMNFTNTFEYKSPEYNQLETDYALVSAQANNGEELIYLGAYGYVGYTAGSVANTVNVEIQNINSSQKNTGPVSLVLSGGRQMTWDLTLDTSVDLNSIVLFGLVGDQSLLINNTTIDLTNNSNSLLGIDIKHSEISVCGYALPQDSLDCKTDELLGINQETNFLGIPIFTNSLNMNYLAQKTDLKVTNFNGAYEANDFVVGIDTTAVPLPGALLLFISSLCLVSFRSKARINGL